MDDPQRSNDDGHGSLIMLRLAVFSVPLLLLVIVSILSTLNLVKILGYPKSVGVISNVTISTTQGRLATTFYDYAVSFETAEKQKIYTNVGKTVFIEAYVKGDAVTVYHERGNPFVAFVNHAATIWFVPITFASSAVIWLIIGVLLTRRRRGKP